MLIRFLRFWRGTISFQVTGRFLERFLNLAARAKIPIWDGVRQEQCFSGKTLAEKEEELHGIAEKVQLEWESRSCSGAPKLWQSYGKRLGILVGATVLLLAGILSQQFVWKITVHGNETVSSQEILSIAQDLGLKKGVWKRSLDVIELADRMTLQLEPVSWAAVNLLGTVAEIEIVERVMPPELLNEETPCNVVAAHEGQIVELDVYEGDKMRMIGDGVKEGDLIVSGIVEDKHGKAYYKHARANVVVEYVQEETVEVPLHSTELMAAGPHENSYRLLLGEWSLPLSFGDAPSGSGFSTDAGLVESGVFHSSDGSEQWFYWVRNQPLELFDVELPLGLQIQQYIPAEAVEIALSDEQAKEIALLKMEQKLRALERQNISIVHKELVGEVKQGKFCLSARLTCRRDGAKQVKIQVKTEN